MTQRSIFDPKRLHPSTPNVGVESFAEIRTDYMIPPTAAFHPQDVPRPLPCPAIADLSLVVPRQSGNTARSLRSSPRPNPNREDSSSSAARSCLTLTLTGPAISFMATP
ncbi:hypothetical protein Vi05172_g4262 [Venturia inaequalis]|nr:hypothetical protein Vi05172_g4262 [Venturia inaequalis]